MQFDAIQDIIEILKREVAMHFHENDLHIAA
jgi:hypothetical protein